MNDLQVAWRQVTARLVTHGLTVATIALAVGLAVATDLLAQGVQRGIDRAAGPFDVLVGSRGNAQQLVINSVLLQGDPLENVPEDALGSRERYWISYCRAQAVASGLVSLNGNDGG